MVSISYLHIEALSIFKYFHLKVCMSLTRRKLVVMKYHNASPVNLSHISRAFYQENKGGNHDYNLEVVTIFIVSLTKSHSLLGENQDDLKIYKQA